MVNIVDADPAVDTVTGSTGGSGGSAPSTQGRACSFAQAAAGRKITVYQVIERLRPKLATVPGPPLPAG
jgi:hypothetical protein